MIALPAIVLCALLAMLSIVAATILSKWWMQYIALACALLEIAVVIFLVIIAP